MKKGTTTHMSFWPSLGGINLFTHGLKIRVNAYGNIERGHH